MRSPLSVAASRNRNSICRLVGCRARICTGGFAGLGLRDRAQAVVVAHETGLVRPGGQLG
ncbi:hypothetical protein ACF1GT_21490 [Streptomyces sp. NPDC014636]|uniref:hypothetical protein n=1 Tax=Streptomyces sp. NPDC014636 TaxID=3364876 RepID=UPI0036F5947B